MSDFTTSISDYGSKQPGCYEFRGAGKGKGLCVKNQAASVWNRTGKPVTVYYNSSLNKTIIYLHANPTVTVGAKVSKGTHLGYEDWRGVS